LIQVVDVTHLLLASRNGKIINDKNIVEKNAYLKLSPMIEEYQNESYR
jgi:hypothetical protein